MIFSKFFHNIRTLFLSKYGLHYQTTPSILHMASIIFKEYLSITNTIIRILNTSKIFIICSPFPTIHNILAEYLCTLISSNPHTYKFTSSSTSIANDLKLCGNVNNEEYVSYGCRCVIKSTFQLFSSHNVK